MNRTATDRLQHLMGTILLCLAAILLLPLGTGLAPLYAAESTEAGSEMDPIEETDVATFSVRHRRVLPVYGSAGSVCFGQDALRVLSRRLTASDEWLCSGRATHLYPLRR